MQKSLNKSNASNLHKQSNQSFNQSRNNQFFQQISSKISKNQFNSLLTTEPPQSLLQQLIPKRQISNLTKINSRNLSKNKKQILLDIEQRIFSQVLELIDQIDLLKLNIVTVRQEIRQLQISNPDIQQQVKFHGYGQPLTGQQCSDLEQENLQLIKQIQQIEARQINSLEQVLKIQKQRYQELKQELTESGSTKNIDKQIKDLKISISQLQNSRSAIIRNQYPQFEQLKMQNQELRIRTLANLKNQKISEQQRQLQQYLQNEQNDRIEFMEELKSFKSEYNRIKNQNQILRQKLMRRQQSYSKQNSKYYNKRKTQPNNNSFYGDSKISKNKGKDRFSQYESHIKMMQNKLN